MMAAKSSCKPQGARKFYHLPSDFSAAQVKNEDKDDGEQLLKFIHSSLIGVDLVFTGPFGKRKGNFFINILIVNLAGGSLLKCALKVEYCDYTASGRAVNYIEDFLKEEVLPHYANTHTTTSVTSLQTTLYRHEARDIIRDATNASEHDAVLFVGNGTTGAVHHLIHALDLPKPPIVYVGPHEHHSNLLPWREIAAKVIQIEETEDGSVDLCDLENKLREHHKGDRQLIGCFAAASNITGILSEDLAISALLHSHGALAFWDYAAAAPYVKVDMNPVVPGPYLGLVYKDALYFSMHKFVGGVETPGILIAKKNLFRNIVPETCGGGTVFFVTKEDHRYLKDIENREEGGTPAIIQSIRAGLAMQLKMWVNPTRIMRNEEEICRKAWNVWNDVEELVILGSQWKTRLAIFSFLVKPFPKRNLFLHYNFICVLLNDLFGIQARGGCACAGPYAQNLLGIDVKIAHQYECLLLEDSRLDRTHLRRHEEGTDNESLRPGFARINLSYFSSAEEIDFIIEAVKLIAKDGWKLLPLYRFNLQTGEWLHHTETAFKDRKWLSRLHFHDGEVGHDLVPELPTLRQPPATYTECMNEATSILTDASKLVAHRKLPDESVLFSDEVNKWRWFLLPSEARDILMHLGKISSLPEAPFTPRTYHQVDDSQSKNHESYWTDFHEGMYDPLNELHTSARSQLASFVKHQEHHHQDDRVQESHHDGKSFLNSVQSVWKHFKPPKEKKTEDLKLGNRRKFSCPDENLEFLRKGEEGGKPYERGLHKSSEEILIPVEQMQWHSPPKSIIKPALEALEEYQMIQGGDRVLVCLSGGKDSMSLLHTLRQYQFIAKAQRLYFSLGAVTVDPGSKAYNPRPLIPYLHSLGIPYFYEEQEIVKQAEYIEDLNSICSFCSRMKRGRIYTTARREGYNVVALAHHLDDLAESFLMSAFHNGRLRTMKACYTVREGDLRIIRPFIYVREKELREFAETKSLPVIPENCPACFETPKERYRTKQLLAQQEILFPTLFNSLRATMHPLMAIGETGVESLLSTHTAGLSKRLNSIHHDDDDNF